MDPQLVLTGEAYASMTFEALYARICDALRRDRPRVVATVLLPGERTRVLYEDGSTREVEWLDEEADSHRGPDE